MKTLLFLFCSCCLALSLPAQSAAKPLRVAVAGMTHGHVHWILRRAADADIEIVGIAESNEELALRLMKQYKLDKKLLFPDLPSLLAKVQPEAVTAFGSIYEHMAVVEACAPKGIHVMVEKPLAVSMEHATRMANLVEEHNIFLLTNYETTWYGSNHALYQQVVEEKRYGDIRKVVVHDGHPGPIEINCNPEFLEWLLDPEQNGAGALTDFGCYGANLLTWLMQNEKPLSVTAITQQIKPDLYPKVDDEATIVLTYPTSQAIIQASWNWPVGRKDLQVYGRTGYAHTVDGSEMKLRLNEKEAEVAFTAPDLVAPRQDPFVYLKAVVRGEIQPAGDLSSLENNLIVVEILSAAIRSAQEGKTIVLQP